MPYTDHDARLIAHNEALWDSMNSFFARFNTDDWMRQHGKDWTFGDVPYHLMYFQTLAVDAIKKGRTNESHEEIRTVRELNAFNNSRFAARPGNQTGEQSFSLFRRSQESLRQAIRGLGADQPNLDHEVWYGVLRGRGWRTTRFMLEYTFWHNWLHYSESYLRYFNEMPPLDADVMHHALDTHMDFTAGALNHAAAASRFVWMLTLTGNGGGTWTFEIENGEGRVRAGSIDNEVPHVSMERSIDVHMKAAVYHMMNPLRANLASKIKTRGGLASLNLLAKLFTPKEDEVWTPIAETEVEELQA